MMKVLGSLVPVKVGVLSLVELFCVGVVMVGGTGAVVSMVKLLVFDATEVLFAASVAVAGAAHVPAAPGVVPSHVKLPVAFAVAVHCTTPPMRTFTVLPGSAVPE